VDRRRVFDVLATEALAAYDRILELDLDVVALDGSIHKAPCGGEGTGRSPVDRGKLGWKWSVACDRAGIPIGVAIDGANRSDIALLGPTIDAIEASGLLGDIGTLSLDRGYDYPAVRARLEDRGLDDLDIQRRGTKPKPGEPHRLTLGLRWIVEATNTWLSNYGQLRRSTDRRERHRHAALRLATAVLIIGRLIDYRNRGSHTPG
jgi:transposase